MQAKGFARSSNGALLATVRRGQGMISPGNLRKGSIFSALLILLAMLSGCITSREVLLNGVTTPARVGKYEVQYLVDGKWTKFGAGSLVLRNRKYTWVEDREASSLFNWNPEGLGFALVAIGNNYFIIVVTAADLGNPMWAGKYMYGIARRAGDAFLYDFPSCFDLLASQGISDPQVEKIGAHECLYSSKASLASALTLYAKRTALWKRLVPSIH
jgi:hypothetical protein